MTRVLVTGANGFVGGAVCRALQGAGYLVRGAQRSDQIQTIDNKTAVDTLLDKQRALQEIVVVGDIGPETDWAKALDGVDAVVHLAARVHVMQETASDPLSEFRRTNTLGTEHLAQSAAETGVSRFVYISSVKVNGEQTVNAPFSELDIPYPEDPYAVSKREAEQALQEIARKTGLKVVIVRPPLVYGPHVKGNFLQLMKWVYRGIPLPFGSVNNRRSFIGVNNLADFILQCVHHPRAPGETFLVADGEDLSTADLIKRLAQAFRRSPQLFHFPLRIMWFITSMLGKEDLAQKILGSLQIDSGKARHLLEWVPPLSVDEGLFQTAAWYKRLQSKA